MAKITKKAEVSPYKTFDPVTLRDASKKIDENTEREKLKQESAKLRKMQAELKKKEAAINGKVKVNKAKVDKAKATKVSAEPVQTEAETETDSE